MNTRRCENTYKTGRGDLEANRGTPNGRGGGLPHYHHATHVLRHEVIIAIVEAGTGAILKDLHELLLRLEERSNPATDTTHYGNSRVSATSFYQRATSAPPSRTPSAWRCSASRRASARRG